MLVLIIFKDSGEDDIYSLHPLTLVSRIMGGGSPSPAEQAAKPSDFTPMTSSAMGFHPIPGKISSKVCLYWPPFSKFCNLILLKKKNGKVSLFVFLGLWAS